VNATVNTTPKDATHWSVRAMAASQKVSPATVQRIWKLRVYYFLCAYLRSVCPTYAALDRIRCHPPVCN